MTFAQNASAVDTPGSDRNESGFDLAILLTLLIILLFSPYLPQFPPIEQRVRIDHFVVPLLFIFLFVRNLFSRRLVITLPVILHAFFIIWLLLSTLLDYLTPPSGFGIGTFTNILAGMDAYSRPMIFLFIAANLKIGADSYLKFSKFFLLAGIVLVAIGFCQQWPLISPAPNSPLNIFIFNWYDNADNAVLYWGIVGGGYAVSLFGQYGTYAMFCLLGVTLLATQFMGAKIFRSNLVIAPLLLIFMIGGYQSGSKVFAGGGAIILLFYIFLSPFPRIIFRRQNMKIVGVFVTFVILFVIVAPQLYRTSYFERIYEINKSRFDPTRIYQTYFATRFGGEENGSVPKLVETGVFDIFHKYPITGLGFSVISRTTDSFIMGIIAMGGVVGMGLYLLFLLSVLMALWHRVRKSTDPSQKEIARGLVFFIITCFAIGIGFHALIQDRAGDSLWLLTGLLLPKDNKAGFVRVKWLVPILLAVLLAIPMAYLFGNKTMIANAYNWIMGNEYDVIVDNRTTKNKTKITLYDFTKLFPTAKKLMPPQYYGMQVFHFKDLDQQVLFAHCGSRFEYNIHVPDGAWLDLGIAMSPEVYSKPTNGAVFMAYAIHDGTEEMLFRNVLMPKENNEDRGIHYFDYDMKKFAGKDITLAFVTKAHSYPDYCWSAWVTPRLVAQK